ncbi:IMPACT family protein [Alteromonas oceanisediminis]|uniref:IMPACT family protein n=1 Tax=Alteromonas oceanisediminis TaxID=2836180 RepID=UPI001BD95107|nr:YigZ family protein [Alteromonas oceanisediminis]MBT0585422.1 YigZ family protein [Alteromonas oceanisediminis]
MSYPIPRDTLETSLSVKKSVFHACAGLATDRAAAMTLLAECQSRYPDARHHCWAYLLGNPNSPSSAAMSDDGEPSGTAGKPILNVLQHKGVGDIVVVVSRYFGGIKLGAGGLVRAYSGATQQTMERLTLITRVTRIDCTVLCDFKHEQYLRLWVTQQQGEVRECEYFNHVVMHLALPEKAILQIDSVLAPLEHAKRIKNT